MIKIIYNFETKQVTGGCEYGMNCTVFTAGDNISFKDNASFKGFDGKSLEMPSWLLEPNITCTIKKVGHDIYPQRNNQLLLGACYKDGVKVRANSDIKSWIPKDEVNKVL